MQNFGGETYWIDANLEDREINGKVILRCILSCEAERWMFLANHCVFWWVLELAVWKWILLLGNVISELMLFYCTYVAVHL
jgi:hypothetical protein